MVGEIRDTETARIAMRAALTGHLVFSTLHTNTAVGAIATLSHMGIEPYMLVSAITGVISQRLLRKICASCKKSFTPTQELLQALKIETASRKRLYRGQGCDNCMKSGYEGRTGLFELMPLTEEIRAGILTHRSEHDLVAMVRGNGIKSLLDYATIKLYGGIISPEEVLDTLIAED